MFWKTKGLIVYLISTKSNSLLRKRVSFCSYLCSFILLFVRSLLGLLYDSAIEFWYYFLTVLKKDERGMWLVLTNILLVSSLLNV